MQQFVSDVKGLSQQCLPLLPPEEGIDIETGCALYLPAPSFSEFVLLALILQRRKPNSI